MKFLILTLLSLVSLSAFSQSQKTNTTPRVEFEFHHILHQELEHTGKLIFPKNKGKDILNGKEKVVIFRQEISNLKQQVDTLIDNFEMLDESCAEDIELYKKALFSRFNRLIIVRNQYDEDFYSRNFIFNYKFEYALIEYFGSKDPKVKKAYRKDKQVSEDIMQVESKEKLAIKVAKLEVKLDHLIMIAQENKYQEEVKVYSKVIVPNQSRCTLTARAIKKNGIIEEYKPKSKIGVSFKNYKDGKNFGWIFPSEIDSFYKTLKFMICEP